MSNHVVCDTCPPTHTNQHICQVNYIHNSGQTHVSKFISGSKIYFIGGPNATQYKMYANYINIS